MTIPPISSDSKRIFSLMGLLPTVNRAQLQPDIIGASMAVGSWRNQYDRWAAEAATKGRKGIDVVGRKDGRKRCERCQVGPSASTPCQDSR